MADDREQRAFELVKLRIAFLQHVTTLSGAAILIILALIRLVKTAEIAGLLTITTGAFTLAVLISVSGLMRLLVFDDFMDNPAREDQGVYATIWAGAAFWVGVSIAGLAAIGTPLWVHRLLFYPFAAVASVLVAVLLIRWLRRRSGSGADRS